MVQKKLKKHNAYTSIIHHGLRPDHVSGDVSGKNHILIQAENLYINNNFSFIACSFASSKKELLSVMTIILLKI